MPYSDPNLVSFSGPPYRGPSGHWLTNTLFYEQWVKLHQPERVYNPVFSLHDDLPDLINARKTFLAFEDPTGYKWAMKYLGSFEHWKMMNRGEWFKEALGKWLEELKTKLQSDAITKIRSIAGSNDRNALQAAKYLASHEWEAPRHSRGRPSSQELRGELAKARAMIEADQEDTARIEQAMKGMN